MFPFKTSDEKSSTFKVKIMRRAVAYSLLAAMLAAMYACGEKTNTENTDALTDSSDYTAEEKSPLDDDLGEYDFGGETFVIDTRAMTSDSWLTSVMDVELETGDVLLDSIYRRNRKIEQRFNCQIRERNSDDRNNSARNQMLSGDPEFDVFLLTDRSALVFAQDDLVVPFDTIEQINLEKPYWSPSLNKYLSIGGRLYFAYGDYELIPYDYTHMLLFNKKIADDLNLDSPYELVKSGSWTIDAMSEMMKAATRDLDGNTVMDENDCWGYLSQAHPVLPGFWVGAGAESVSKNADDIPEFTLAGDQHFAEIIEKVFKITWDDGTWFKDVTRANYDTTSRDMFANNKGLFHDSTFYNITLLRGMDTDFGVLPYPKWDSSQGSYYSRVEGGDFPMIPKTNQRLEMTGVILEALASESAKSVIPEYYEKVLKGKGARDDESEDMLDIIYNNRVYDLGDTYWCTSLRGGFLMTMFETGKRDLASNIAKKQSSVEKEINKVVDAFMALNNK